MENATKALVIAGGVLIAILTIGLLTYMVRNISDVKRIDEETERIRQITEFNAEYSSFNKSLMRGTDVITVFNKAINHNELTADNPPMRITVYFKLVTEGDMMLGRIVNGKIQEGDIEYGKIQINKYYEVVSQDSLEYKLIWDSPNARKKFKERFFKCSGIEYSQETGLVNKLYFEEVGITEQIN